MRDENGDRLVIFDGRVERCGSGSGCLDSRVTQLPQSIVVQRFQLSSIDDDTCSLCEDSGEIYELRATYYCATQRKNIINHA
jgi:hypothetical protein